ncbi:hypothetical protein HRI_000230300 [Hibiscus trionum]|uniref:Transmembrane protein n=1 Tax=Hibiscus trionum TaxID=183268 RepID=A0A9W7GU09_HIBTR|nr:hypothetical protein HRI_000230300 [Hibiscus trionum]
MQSTVQLKSQFLHPRTIFFLNPLLKSTISLQNFNYSSKSPVFTASPLFQRKTQIQKPIICARKSKRRPGSRISTNVALELISILASNLKILPPPLDLVLQHLVAADGEDLGFLNGFNGGRFHPWKRRRARKRNGEKILGFLVILGSCIVCLLIGKELRSDVLFGILGFIFFVFALIKGWRRGFKDWIFGFVCVGILLGLGLMGNGGMKWIKEIRVPSSSSMMEIVRRGKRRGRWAL